jgi:hypothetical protein
MFVVRGADHLHFVDDVPDAHESLRLGTLPGEAAWIPAAMRPLAQLCPPEQAHEAARGLTLAHFDATLRGDREAAGFLESAGSTAGQASLAMARVYSAAARAVSASRAKPTR